MNKKIIIIFAAVIMAAVFTACSNSAGHADENTSAADSSDFAFSEENSSFADITNAKIDAPSASAQKIPDEHKNNEAANDDNEIEFNAGNNNGTQTTAPGKNTTAASQNSGESHTTAAAQESTTKKTEPATDKDGWINKWY